MDDPTDDAFTAAFAVADRVPGWLTRDQARRLWEHARALPDGAVVVEIGAHQGRSTLVLAQALRAVDDALLVTIDAFVDGPRYGGTATRELLERNLVEAGVDRNVRVLAGRSQAHRQSWTQPIDLLWIDGKHDYWTCSDDLRWAAHLPPRGRVLVHDAFSSVGVTLSLLVHVLVSRRLRFVRRTGSLAELELAAPTAADRRAFVAQLPWWARNVAVKVLLRLRLQAAAARMFGHTGSADPY